MSIPSRECLPNLLSRCREQQLRKRRLGAQIEYATFLSSMTSPMLRACSASNSAVIFVPVGSSWNSRRARQSKRKSDEGMEGSSNYFCYGSRSNHQYVFGRVRVARRRREPKTGAVGDESVPWQPRCRPKDLFHVAGSICSVSDTPAKLEPRGSEMAARLTSKRKSLAHSNKTWMGCR